MQKLKYFLFFTFLLSTSILSAQKNSVAVGANVGANLPISDAEYYKSGLHLGAIIAYTLTDKNDAVTANVGYHTFPNKLLKSDVVKLMDVKVGYRFLPSKTVPIYIHPNAGLGFFADGSGDKTSLAVGMGVGYLPKLGNGNLNVFAAYNFHTAASGIKFINLGIGYQFRLGK